MKTRHIALVAACLLAYPADMIAACAATEKAPQVHVEMPKPGTAQKDLPKGTEPQLRMALGIRVSATMIALDKFVSASCPNMKFDPAGAAKAMSVGKVQTDDLPQDMVKDLSEQQLAYYQGMDAKEACGIIVKEFGPIGAFMPDVVVQASK